MITVFLYGELARQFGEKFQFDAKSPAEACRALEANFPGKFYKALAGNEYKVVRGEDLEAGEAVVEELLQFEQQKDIHFVPVIRGSKSRGVFQTILGVVLIAAAVVVSIYFPPAAGGFWATVGGINMGSVAVFGASLVVGGVYQMLTPLPEIPGGGIRENQDPRKSFLFSGAENVEGQGVPVPFGYGEFEVGSVVISRSLTIGDMPTNLSQYKNGTLLALINADKILIT